MDWPEALNNPASPYSLFWNLASKAPFLLPVMLRMMSISPKGENVDMHRCWRGGVNAAQWVSDPPHAVGSTGLNVVEGIGD